MLFGIHYSLLINIGVLIIVGLVLYFGIRELGKIHDAINAQKTQTKRLQNQIIHGVIASDVPQLGYRPSDEIDNFYGSCHLDGSGRRHSMGIPKDFVIINPVVVDENILESVGDVSVSVPVQVKVEDVEQISEKTEDVLEKIEDVLDKIEDVPMKTGEISEVLEKVEAVPVKAEEILEVLEKVEENKMEEVKEEERKEEEKKEDDEVVENPEKVEEVKEEKKEEVVENPEKKEMNLFDDDDDGEIAVTVYSEAVDSNVGVEKQVRGRKKNVGVGMNLKLDSVQEKNPPVKRNRKKNSDVEVIEKKTVEQPKLKINLKKKAEDGVKVVMEKEPELEK